jgi:hypothetical protein
MNDFLSFRKMMTPVIIKIIFWIGVGLSVLGGLITMIIGFTQLRYGGVAMVFGGLAGMLLGPFIVRIWCELLIVIFQINDSLTDIRNVKVREAYERYQQQYPQQPPQQ